MQKAKKIIFIISLVYISLGLIFFALNGFSLIKGVSRQPIDPRCINPVVSNNILDFTCAQTADLRIGHYINWISWIYFSNEVGNDEAKYLPLDIFSLILVNGFGYAFFHRKRS